MKDLNLPVFKKPMLEPKPLTMEQYLEFVQFNWRYVVNKKAFYKQKKQMRINVPFKMTKGKSNA